MLGQIVGIAAAEVVDRTMSRRRRARRHRVPFEGMRNETCRTCGTVMWGGEPDERPFCVNANVCAVGANNLQVVRERNRATYAANQARQARTRAVRQPPRNTRPEPGTCSLCAGPVTGRRRTWCSTECVKLWDLATRPSLQRQHLRAFFDGCWECGQRTGLVDVDHVRPLWSLTDDERRQLRWWLPFNLQLLCSGCHKAKTRREAGERAAARR